MAVTTATIAAGSTLAGMGIEAAQLIKQNKLEKEAQAAAGAAAKKLESMQLQNAYAGLQVPTLGYELAQEGLDRQTMGALQAAQGSPEAMIGSVGAISKAAEDERLRQMAALQQEEAQRNKLVAQGQQYADVVNLQNARELEGMRLTGAQEAAKQARLNKQKAISGMIDLGVAGLGYAAEDIPLYNEPVDLSQISKDITSVEPLLNLMSQPKIN
jgi:hypothetical protein